MLQYFSRSCVCAWVVFFSCYETLEFCCLAGRLCDVRLERYRGVRQPRAQAQTRARNHQNRVSQTKACVPLCLLSPLFFCRALPCGTLFFLLSSVVFVFVFRLSSFASLLPSGFVGWRWGHPHNPLQLPQHECGMQPPLCNIDLWPPLLKPVCALFRRYEELRKDPKEFLDVQDFHYMYHNCTVSEYFIPLWHIKDAHYAA